MSVKKMIFSIPRWWMENKLPCIFKSLTVASIPRTHATHVPDKNLEIRRLFDNISYFNHASFCLSYQNKLNYMSNKMGCLQFTLHMWYICARQSVNVRFQLYCLYVDWLMSDAIWNASQLLQKQIFFSFEYFEPFSYKLQYG